MNWKRKGSEVSYFCWSYDGYISAMIGPHQEMAGDCNKVELSL
jgi:calcineurin-like phosphoesterase